MIISINSPYCTTKYVAHFVRTFSQPQPQLEVPNSPWSDRDFRRKVCVLFSFQLQALTDTHTKRKLLYFEWSPPWHLCNSYSIFCVKYAKTHRRKVCSPFGFRYGVFGQTATSMGNLSSAWQETKHWLMMPNHVSTHAEVIATWHSLHIHRNKNHYVIHLLVAAVNFHNVQIPIISMSMHCPSLLFSLHSALHFLLPNTLPPQNATKV